MSFENRPIDDRVRMLVWQSGATAEWGATAGSPVVFTVRFARLVGTAGQASSGTQFLRFAMRLVCALLLCMLGGCQVFQSQLSDSPAPVVVDETEGSDLAPTEVAPRITAEIGHEPKVHPMNVMVPGHCAPGVCLPDAAGYGGKTFVSAEEYLCNGGDREPAVVVKRNWEVGGLHAGDAVMHFDTIDGTTHVVPSNEVCLYAPRFASVRKVYGLVINEQHDRPAGVEIPLRIVQGSDVGEPTTVTQPLQPGRKHAIRGAHQFRERALGEGIENAQRPGIAEDQFLPFEDLAIIRRGAYDNTEKARLAARLQAAIAWTSDVGPQVLIDNKTAVQLIGNTDLQSVYTYELPPGKSRVQIVKIASKQNARPGDTVDFTIRFDNVGDRAIGNVTVLDRLHDRLELVEGSASCTLEHNFSTEAEDGSPRVLRWDITAPLEVGDGGVIRFQCRVR